MLNNLPGHCVGVMSFVLHVFQLLPIRFTQENLCGISKFIYSETSVTAKLKIKLALISYGYWKCMFVDFLIRCIGPPNCVHYLSVE